MIFLQVGVLENAKVRLKLIPYNGGIPVNFIKKPAQQIC